LQAAVQVAVDVLIEDRRLQLRLRVAHGGLIVEDLRTLLIENLLCDVSGGDQLLIAHQVLLIVDEILLRLRQRCACREHRVAALTDVQRRGVPRLRDLRIIGFRRPLIGDDRRLRLGELRAQVGRVEHCQHLAGTDAVAFVDVDDVRRLRERARDRDVEERSDEAGDRRGRPDRRDLRRGSRDRVR
jgi:hypothetical protein